MVSHLLKVDDRCLTTRQPRTNLLPQSLHRRDVSFLRQGLPSAEHPFLTIDFEQALLHVLWKVGRARYRGGMKESGSTRQWQVHAGSLERPSRPRGLHV